MATFASTDRNHESIVNDTLARFLREQCGLSAVAETLHGGRRPDIIVRKPDGPVILETEFEPATTVEADALSRLGMKIDGQRVQNVFAVTVPGSIRLTSQKHLYSRLGSAQLEWHGWRIDGTAGPKDGGTATELASVVQRTTPAGGGLDEAVEALEQGAKRAGVAIFYSPGTLGRVSRVFGAEPSDEVANMAALVIINAMIFQERLASSEMAFVPVSGAVRDGGFSLIALLQIGNRFSA